MIQVFIELHSPLLSLPYSVIEYDAFTKKKELFSSLNNPLSKEFQNFF